MMCPALIGAISGASPALAPLLNLAEALNVSVEDLVVLTA
jgi:hypothetical protein